MSNRGKKIAKLGLLLVALLPYIDWILVMIIVGEGVKTKDPFFMALTIFWIISIPVSGYSISVMFSETKQCQRGKMALGIFIVRWKHPDISYLLVFPYLER